MKTAKYLEQAVDAAKHRLIQERLKLAQLRHAAVVSATQRVAATKQLESIEQHNSAAAGQISLLQSKVTQAQAAETAARAVAQRHKLMAQSLQKRAQVFAGKSIEEHKKSLAYAADAVKMKAMSQQDALLTLNAINAMQTGKALPKGSPSMETLGANAKVAMNNMNVDDSNARIEAARSKQAFDSVVQLKSMAKKYLADAAADNAAIARAHNTVLATQSARFSQSPDHNFSHHHAAGRRCSWASDRGAARDSLSA